MPCLSLRVFAMFGNGAYPHSFKRACTQNKDPSNHNALRPNKEPDVGTKAKLGCQKDKRKQRESDENIGFVLAQLYVGGPFNRRGQVG